MGESECRARVNKPCAGHGLIPASFCRQGPCSTSPEETGLPGVASPSPCPREPQGKGKCLGSVGSPLPGTMEIHCCSCFWLGFTMSCLWLLYSNTFHSACSHVLVDWKRLWMLDNPQLPNFPGSPVLDVSPVSLLEGEGVCRVGTCPSKGDASAPQILAWRP